MDIVPGDVVISGIGGYFPKSTDVNQFKTRLFNNEIMVEPRKSIGEKGNCNIIGTIASDYFDNSYFGIHRHQCTFMDPMHRLALERTFEALVDAGVNPTEIKGKRIGVYIGSAIGENDNLFMESVVSGFGVTGHSRAMMPNRISYWLNLKGPSVAYDVNWVSGIEVLRLAYNSIKTGQCDSVIVGTANLALHAEFQFIYNDMGLLSQDGSTRAFDANASGYARSDGVVMMYIQRASEARRSYASIVNVMTRFDGNHEGNLTALNVNNMTKFLDEFYEKSPIKQDEVEFVETYGCALKDIDEKEVEALEKVYCKTRKTPLPIGSIKTQTGHSEATACLFSVVKVLLAMEERIIPATLQFETPNPNIPALLNGKVKVITENTPWKGVYAAINALGIVPIYGHILLKANLKEKVPIKMDLPRLLFASTRTEEGIAKILDTLKSKPKDAEFYKLVQQVFSKPIQGHLYRGYLTMGGDTIKHNSMYHVGAKRQIWFVYSGMGSQWSVMINDLMQIDVFAKSIMKSHEILLTKGVDLLNILSSQDKTVFDNILNCFVGIAAMQIALTDVLKLIGIVPDGIIGHSVGELGCAYADNCMTAEQMILSAYSRGRASLEATLIRGMMAAVGLGYNQIKDRLPATIEVACHNSVDSCTISGPEQDMEKFVKELQNEGIFARLVNVANIAYHSQYIKPAAPLLLKYLKEVIPTPIARSSKWISTSNKQENWDTDLAKTSSAEYHTNNLLSSVLFEEGSCHIPKDSVLIEIAPHGLLQAILKRSVKTATNVPLTQRGCKSSVEFLLQSLGKLYLAGLDFNISNLYPKIEYPVSRGTPHLADLVQWNHAEKWKSGLTDRIHSSYGVRELDITLNSEEFRTVVGHQLNNCIILPTSYYLNILLQILESITSEHTEVVYDNINFKKPLVIPRIGTVPLHVMIQKGSGEFEVLSNDDLLMTGKITFSQSGESSLLNPEKVETSVDNVLLTASDIYNELQHRGHKYSGVFKSVKSVTLSDKGSVGIIQSQDKWMSLLEGMLQQKYLHAGERRQKAHVINYIQKIVISFNDLPAEKTDVSVDYDYATNMLTVPGIQVIGVTTAALEYAEKQTHLRTVECFPLYNNNYKNIECGIELAIQLALSNCINQGEDISVFITEVQSDNSLHENIQNVVIESSMIHANIIPVTDLKQIVVQQIYPQIIIVNDVATIELYKIVASSNAYLLSKADKSVLYDNKVIEVAQFNVRGTTYSITKRVESSKPLTVMASGDIINSKDLKRSSVPWVSELHSAVQQAASQCSPVYLITSLIPIEGFNNFVQDIRLIPDMKDVHFIFNLDKKVENYSEIYKRNIPMTIIKNGVPHTCLSLSLKYNANYVDQATSNILNNRTVSFLSVNLKDETLNPAKPKLNEVGNVDYSGVTNTGKRVMGLVYVDESCKMIEDPIFSWEIPEDWSLEDGVTVPHAYVSAYYMLMIKGRLKPGNTVLIHAGCSPIGLAATSIASFYGCEVFVTVSSDVQRAYIRQYFSGLRERNVLSSDSSVFHDDLMTATGGKGAEVILNCVSGHLLTSSLACIADYGRFIQYGKYDVEEGNSIGMYCFLRNTSFYFVDLENVFNQPKDVKEEIRQLVRYGIDNFIVRPMYREIVRDFNVSKTLSKLKDSSNIGKIIIQIDNSLAVNKLNVKKPNQFICNWKNSYLVYGGSAENWTDVAEWLVLHGARKIVISTDSKPQQNHINRRLSLLQTYYGADVVLAPSKAHTREGAMELLSEVYLLGPIHAIFTIPSKSTGLKNNDTKAVQYLDNASRSIAPKALFVNFVNVAVGICQSRVDAGFATYNVHWSKNSDFVDSINMLDDIFNIKVTNVLVKRDHGGELGIDAMQGIFQDLAKILPSTEEIIEKQKECPDEPDLVQVITEGPLEIRELAPLFIIPGLRGHSELDQMVMQLLYPTFCAIYPSKPMSISKMAEIFVEKICTIYPKGVYNIIGISWGGALMIEIARLLQKRNASLHLFFVDSAPNTIQRAFKQLGEKKDDIEVNILRNILGINDTELLQKVKSAKHWESRISVSLEAYDGEAKKQKLLREGLVSLRDQIESMFNFQLNEELVSGGIHLIRPNNCSKYDSCGLSSYCEQPARVVLVEGDHLSIISSRDTTDYINSQHRLK